MIILGEYSAREWFRLRRGLELWEVSPADLVRYNVCREVADELARR